MFVKWEGVIRGWEETLRQLMSSQLVVAANKHTTTQKQTALFSLLTSSALSYVLSYMLRQRILRATQFTATVWQRELVELFSY